LILRSTASFGNTHTDDLVEEYMLRSNECAGNPSGILVAVVALATVIIGALLASAGSASAATRDTTRPAITGVSPGENATDVAVSTNVRVTFSESMNRKTLTGGTFHLSKSGAKVAANVSCNSPCRTAELNPKQDMKPGSVYQASVRGGRKGLKDLADNRLISGKQWSFTTAPAANVDVTKPTITLPAPSADATYTLRQDVKARYSCHDEVGGSGLKSCEGTVLNGSSIDTASAGQKSFTVTATDNAGNSTSVTRTYTVSECTILGTEGMDNLVGTEGDDVICGLAGYDTIKGLDGNDILRGGDGRDKLYGGPGDDALDGGPGTDGVDFAGSSSGVVASLVTNTASGEGSDTLTSVESLNGSRYADELTGSANANYLYGASGADTLLGLEGADTLSGAYGNDTMQGGAANDKLNGGAGADDLLGEEDDDALKSQDGVSGNDSLDGGTGTDTMVKDATEASIVNIP
jgi:Ca2+-binding RTX toxin-like protein